MASLKILLSTGRKLLPVLMIMLVGLLSSCKSEGKDMKAELFFTAEMVNLLHAIQRKDEITAKLLIKQGVNLNVHGDEGITPLLWLIMQKDAAAVELALQLGADANFPAMVKINREGPKPAQPLAILAGDGDNKLFSMLLKYGADPDSRDESTGRPAIFNIVGHDNWEQFQLLLKAGADINARDNTNRNAALYAATLLKYDFVVKLLELGIDFNEPNKGGVTLAHAIETIFEDNRRNSNFKISENVYTAKKMLETKGVTFPPPTPKEVKAQQGIK